MKQTQLPYSPARIQQLFTFNKADGRLYWKEGVHSHIQRTKMPGLLAGMQRKANHPVWIHMKGNNYPALRIAYVFHFGEDPQGVRFLPKDGDNTNMRPDNIKLVSNERHTLPECVYLRYNKTDKLEIYRADVTVDGVRHMEDFDNLNEAVAWRDEKRATASKHTKWLK